MQKNKETSEKFKISMIENGGHSLGRGIEAYERYINSPNKMLLKDAIMYMHHGIELLMKEILARHSPYLIFDDISDASKKQRQADKQGVGIFFLDRPPKTVTYEEAINRVTAFIKPEEIDDVLTTNLGRLNRIRNQLEHYEIEVDIDEVTSVVSSLRKPLFEFFESELGEIESLKNVKIQQILDNIDEVTRYEKDLEQEVIDVVEKFNGQKIPGKLLNLEGEVTLPHFTKVHDEYLLPEQGIEIDIICENEYVRWAIEVKNKITTANSLSMLSMITQIASNAATVNGRPWLIVFSAVPDRLKYFAKSKSMLVTGIDEWKGIRKIIGGGSSLSNRGVYKLR